MANARIHNEIVHDILDTYSVTMDPTGEIRKDFPAILKRIHQRYPVLSPPGSKSLDAVVSTELQRFKTIFPTPHDFVVAVSERNEMRAVVMRALKESRRSGEMTPAVGEEIRGRLLDVYNGDRHAVGDGLDEFTRSTDERGTNLEKQVVGVFVGSYGLNIEERPTLHKYAGKDYIVLAADTIAAWLGGTAVGGATSAFVMAMIDQLETGGCCGGDGAWGIDDLPWGW